MFTFLASKTIDIPTFLTLKWLSIASFVAQLCSLSSHYKYGNMPENMLHDRIICGILDISIQCRLLAKPKLTAKVMELSQFMEPEEKDL